LTGFFEYGDEPLVSDPTEFVIICGWRGDGRINAEIKVQNLPTCFNVLPPFYEPSNTFRLQNIKINHEELHCLVLTVCLV
jgi:hypothetical protein